MGGSLREEVLVALGIDNSAVERGLGVHRSHFQEYLNFQRSEEGKYSNWWNTELKKREEMEVAASVRAAFRAIQARRLLRERETAREVAANVEQAAANTLIGQGSLPAGWMEQAAAKKAGKELEEKAAKAAIEQAEKKVSAGVMREAMVLVREGFRGDFTRMFGSASKLLGMLGLGITQMLGIGVIIGEVAGIASAWWSMRKAEKAETASETRLDNVQKGIAERLKAEINNLEKAGRVSHEEAQKMAQRLNVPSAQGNKMAQDFIRKHGGVISDKDLEEMKRLDEEHQRKVSENGALEMNAHDRLSSALVRQMVLKDEMAKMDRATIDYKKKQLELDEAQHQADIASKDIQAEKLELQQKINQEQQVVDQAKLRIANIEQSEMEKFMPTLDELAHHGRFGRQARSISRLERHAKREFERGDVVGAKHDIDQRNKVYDSLADRHVVAQRTSLHEIQTLNAEMNLTLKKIAKGEAILKTKFAGVK